MTQSSWVTFWIVMAGFGYAALLTFVARPDQLDPDGLRLFFLAIMGGLGALTMIERALHARVAADEAADRVAAHRKLSTAVLGVILSFGVLALLAAPLLTRTPPPTVEEFAARAEVDLRREIESWPDPHDILQLSELLMAVLKDDYFEERYKEFLDSVPPGERSTYINAAQSRCMRAIRIEVPDGR